MRHGFDVRIQHRVEYETVHAGGDRGPDRQISDFHLSGMNVRADVVDGSHAVHRPRNVGDFPQITRERLACAQRE